ncbi:alpha-1,2-fucosyltransferase [Gillisia sp. JM1]|uniref:alpha-1,2-fucosyltransferase n=1 Tax=Gillisia sp. JM1 TaxID=1283286 RepID=UPI000417B5C0|nr:alpha-1,2-fucosyltransferase [Gillisia sp. JM1]
MIIIKLKGGLGNQMFQYAVSKIITQKNNTNLLIDNSFFDGEVKNTGPTPRNFELAIFNESFKKTSKTDIDYFFKLSFINKFKKKLGFNYPKIYSENSFKHNDSVYLIKNPAYLTGYFQSFKYFLGHENFIKNLYSFPFSKLNDDNFKLLERIKNSESVSIHIRRGDYVSDNLTQKFHGNCSLSYYMDAISLIGSKVYISQLVFFSDDIEWVREQFKELCNPKLFVADNSGDNSWKDMLLMSSCKHNIIANSSFSWWGAWLNKNPNKIVIAPKKWFTDPSQNEDTCDLIPSEWIRI